MYSAQLITYKKEKRIAVRFENKPELGATRTIQKTQWCKVEYQVAHLALARYRSL